MDEINLKLGEHQAAIQMLKEGQDKLFDKTDELLRIAIQNQSRIEGLHNKLDNGIKSRLEEMCGMFKARSKEVDEIGNDFEVRITKLEKISWVGELLDTGWKKMLAFVLAFIVVSALSNATFWGYIKTTVFKETPGTMQTIAHDKK